MTYAKRTPHYSTYSPKQLDLPENLYQESIGQEVTYCDHRYLPGIHNWFYGDLIRVDGDHLIVHPHGDNTGHNIRVQIGHERS